VSKQQNLFEGLFSSACFLLGSAVAGVCGAYIEARLPPIDLRFAATPDLILFYGVVNSLVSTVVGAVSFLLGCFVWRRASRTKVGSVVSYIMGGGLFQITFLALARAGGALDQPFLVVPIWGFVVVVPFLAALLLRNRQAEDVSSRVASAE